MDPADPPLPALSDLAPPEGAVTVLVDADACPVKDEIYRVAERHGAHVRVVSNQMFRVPVSARVKRVTVSDAFDAADDWIAAHAFARTLVVTGDIILADPRDHGRSARRDGRGAGGKRRRPPRSARKTARGSYRRWTGSWCSCGGCRKVFRGGMLELLRGQSP